MPTKIRKQIYLEKRQDRLVKRLAEARGVSEAEIIRGLIDAPASGAAGNFLPPTLPPGTQFFSSFGTVQNRESPVRPTSGIAKRFMRSARRALCGG